MITRPENKTLKFTRDIYSETVSNYSSFPSHLLDAFIHTLKTGTTSSVKYFTNTGIHHMIIDIEQSLVVTDISNPKVILIDQTVWKGAEELIKDIRENVDSLAVFYEPRWKVSDPGSMKSSLTGKIAQLEYLMNQTYGSKRAG